MYDAVADDYCYPGTTVLKNKLDLRSAEELAAFEAEVSDARADEELPAGNLDYEHFKSIHRHLFQDVYDWAGEPRTVRISKGGSMFCFPENIEAEATKLFTGLRRNGFLRGLDLKDFAERSAHFLAVLNAIHAFREGNGRTQLSFFLLLADQAGYALTLQELDPGAFLAAMVASFDGDEAPLAAIIKQLIDSESAG
ncbi:Fic family protein [Bradyrhizobium sp.]|uniref:Fic/DOC family protein n=1 Tax=Bradyrhizobium sp. TaxID=376 RepID=UPI001DA0C273|nr:Fic family protein [Bradyrhizobium sp.]MBI5323438.1 Fic family protein [Bradyrhizobium sp.]